MNIIESAKQTFREEAQAILDLEKNLSSDFEDAVMAIKSCKGRLVVTGVGKSGLIGAKLAATFASTGTPSFFIHPVEAIHGDLGMITKDDIVLAISNSGKTDEILRLIPFLKHNTVPIIAITGNPDSLLANYSSFHLWVNIPKEACPLNLAPTSSTTAALAMGDAMAIALMRVRGFVEEDFAQFHPGGNLGYRLLTKVQDVMQSTDLPVVSKNITIMNAIFEISKAKLGLAVILDGKKVEGLVTDGDVRRAMLDFKAQALDMSVEDIMTKSPKYIHQTASLLEAEELMKTHKLHTVLVLDDEANFVGVLDSVKLVN